MAETRGDQFEAVDGVGRTDAELVAASRKGDQDAFGELVSRHQDRAFNLAYRLTNSHEDAAEAVQEAFLKAYQGMRTFRQQSAFYTWLFRIVVNEVRSRRRSWALRRPAFSLDAAHGHDAGHEQADQASALKAGGLDPSEQASQAERKEIVEQALQALDFEQRTIIVLRDIEGRDYSEIAEELGCPEGTVKSRLHRARIALKDALTPKLGMTMQ